MKIVGAMADRVARGGVICLHFPIARLGNLLSAGIEHAKKHVAGVNGVANLLRHRAWGEPMMQMNPYHLPDVVTLLEQRGFGPATMRTEHHGRYLTVVLDAQRQK